MLKARRLALDVETIGKQRCWSPGPKHMVTTNFVGGEPQQGARGPAECADTLEGFRNDSKGLPVHYCLARPSLGGADLIVSAHSAEQSRGPKGVRLQRCAKTSVNNEGF